MRKNIGVNTGFKIVITLTISLAIGFAVARIGESGKKYSAAILFLVVASTYLVANRKKAS